MVSRQGADIWFYMKKAIVDPSWRKHFFSDIKQCITSHYFWMDSFGQYIYRWFLCPIFGHSKVQWAEYWDEDLGHEVHGKFCFHCYRPVKK